jgi:hypothetical protein
MQKEGKVIMIKVIYGEKGMGKTKILIDTANKLASDSKGDVVFIDEGSQLMYDLKHEIRFINVSDFPVHDQNGFFGFVCGIVSQDYDIEGIFIDGLNYITKQKAVDLPEFFKNLKTVSEKFNINFFITINGNNQDIPDFIREFIN